MLVTLSHSRCLGHTILEPFVGDKFWHLQHPSTTLVYSLEKLTEEGCGGRQALRVMRANEGCASTCPSSLLNLKCSHVQAQQAQVHSCQAPLAADAEQREWREGAERWRSSELPPRSSHPLASQACPSAYACQMLPSFTS